MVTLNFNPQVLWLVPCFLSVVFMLWVLWSLHRDETRRR
jgi:hypothetical protein